MNMEVVDLRKGDRFNAVEPIHGTFGAAEVVVLNLSLGGMQIMHANPLRIGTRGRIAFRHGDTIVNIAAHIAWSRVAQPASPGATLYYNSGVQLDAADPEYALAIHTLLKTGRIRQDLDSLDRKRQRMLEREQERARKTPLSRVVPDTTG